MYIYYEIFLTTLAELDKSEYTSQLYLKLLSKTTLAWKYLCELGSNMKIFFPKGYFDPCQTWDGAFFEKEVYVACYFAKCFILVRRLTGTLIRTMLRSNPWKMVQNSHKNTCDRGSYFNRFIGLGLKRSLSQVFYYEAFENSTAWTNFIQINKITVQRNFLHWNCLHTPEVYLKPYQTFNMEQFAKIVKS